MTDQLFVGQLQQKVGELKTEYDLQRSIKDNTINAKIQRSRDKICEILRRVQGRRPKVQTEESEESQDCHIPEEKKPYQSKYNEEVLQRRHYIFQFKMYLRRKRERLQREQEFKLLKLLDQQTEALQKWVTKDPNDLEMFDFFYTQIDPHRKGQVHHLQIKNFMYDNPLIMTLFQFDRQSLSMALDSFPVKERFHLSQDEFIQFLQKYQKVKPEKGFREYVHLFDPIHKQVNLFENTPRILLLEDISIMKEAFDSVSENGLATVDDAIKAIRQNCELFVYAVHVVVFGLNLLLESVLQQIEIGYLNNPDEQISWNQFMYFLDNLPNDQEEEPQPQEQEEAVSSESSDDYFYQMTAKQEIPPPPEPEKKKVRKRSSPRKPFQEINVERMQFTVPKKTGQEKRDVNKQPSIREKWVMEQVRQKQEEIEEAYKFRPFKAKAIPYKVKDKNYYNELLEREEIRRRELKERCKEKTQSLQKPFNFEDRKREKPIKIPEEVEEPHKFRANPIPWYCSLKLYERNMQEQKIKSENRKKIRKFWLQENSKLPPRMQEWIDKMKLQEQEKQQEQLLRSHHDSPRKVRAKSIPNFNKLHDQFQKQLEQKKKKSKPTVPVGPTFHESKKRAQRDYLDEKPVQKDDPLKKAKKATSKKPKIQPRSTDKFNAYVDYIFTMKQNQLALDQQNDEEQKQREDKKQLFRPRVHQSWAIQDHNQVQYERQQQKFIEQYQKRRQEEEDFNNMMKEIFVRVYQRPLLMEVEAAKSQQQPQEEQEQQEQFDYMNPIGEQEVEESERISQQDPEGVDQVGEQAEQSLREYDGQEIDGDYDDQIDIDNLDPKLLEKLQKDAIAKQYGLTEEQMEEIQKMGGFEAVQGMEYEDDEEEEEEEEEDQEEMQNPHYKRHSF
ncbi:unnamed protein product (macronuclear) [Paramecium tetraurelia]|uniref:EF-hand domain-containing protein n=1 Tax=Paramecium tetraurelia TaxID=5888 RepID=A0BTI3_PARTE|nr:uncharacterized protein GSPATT00032082001 [Paramecium tetraurelia]CAK61850.1 unnamed protein product [Paramecium tetraurelia]|eukprot:XP_001429248.1 hypothetical protein (macronuclear) [Paramecium tetraurelia strain d4-2]